MSYPASQSFQGAYLKIARAKHHRQLLQRALRRFRDRYPYRTDTKFDADSGENVSYIHIPRQPLPEWGLIIGDAVHNLRSALDHAVWQLAWRQGTPTNERTIQFPICDTADDFRAQGANMIAELSWQAREHIAKLQPYQKFDRDRDRALRLLRDLDNTDKHRLMHLVMMKSMGAGVVAPPGVSIEFIADATGPLEDGDILGRWRAITDTGESVRLDLSPGFMVETAFASGGLAPGRIVTGVLASLEHQVRKVIVGLEAYL